MTAFDAEAIALAAKLLNEFARVDPDESPEALSRRLYTVMGDALIAAHAAGQAAMRERAAQVAEQAEPFAGGYGDRMSYGRGIAAAIRALAPQEPTP